MRVGFRILGGMAAFSSSILAVLVFGQDGQPSGITTSAICSHPFADADSDGDIDQVDFGVFQRCLTSTPSALDPTCACFDRNTDGLINGYDFSAFLVCHSGPSVPADLACERWPSGLASDDFNSFNLNPAIWTVVDPVGDSRIGTIGTNAGDAQLQISVPARSGHGIFASGITAPYIAQNIVDTDFESEVKFTSLPTALYQVQGIFVEQNADTYLDFELYRDVGGMRCYSAVFSGASLVASQNVGVADGAPMYLRVTRRANQWTAQHSLDGSSWTIVAQFERAMTAGRVGLFVGNEIDAGSPAFTGTVDYFYNTQAPVPAEDAGTVPDTFAPNLFAIESVPDDDAIMVRWSTDEPATSRVDYGTTDSYELGTISNTELTTNHFEQLTALVVGTTYHLRIVSQDAAGNTTTSPDRGVVVIPSSARPSLNFWYSRSLTAGQLGKPQPAINLLGNVSDADGVKWLGYSLNSGPMTILSMGPNTKRLLQTGDFNADLQLINLLTGANTLMVRAVDTLGNVTIRPVTVNRITGNVWPLPYTIDWSQASAINNVAQVVDGHWTLTPDGVRPAAIGYDRLVGIGDLTWQDYEVTVPITVYAVDPNGYTPPSNGPGVGVLCHWVGHSNDGSQPMQGIYPLGGIGLYRWTTSGNYFNIFGNNGVLLAVAPTSDVLQLNVPYYFKIRVQAGTNKVTYRFKVWQVGQTEPGTWKLVGSQSIANDPGHGSVLLLAHHVDASFGNVTIVPGSFP